MLVYVAATCVLWVLSGTVAVAAGLLLAAASVGAGPRWRWLSGGAITLTRGLPTSLLVVGAGVASIRIPPQPWLPDPFPGTPSSAAPVAWAVLAALAVGSAGHFAVIFRTAYRSLGRARIEQTAVLGMPHAQRLGLLVRESATAAIPPTSARLVHHLHNTAFAALFPVADLFGWLEERANATFQVTHYVAVGAAAYVVLSGLIWAAFKALERRLRLPAEAAPVRTQQPVPAAGGAR